MYHCSYVAMSAGPMKDYPNLEIVRGDMWGEKCFNCVFKMIKATLAASDRKSERAHYIQYIHAHTYIHIYIYIQS